MKENGKEFRWGGAQEDCSHHLGQSVFTDEVQTLNGGGKGGRRVWRVSLVLQGGLRARGRKERDCRKGA